MHLVLSWPVRVLVVALIIFSVFVDGSGYWYRIVNHYPLTGYAPGMPPHFLGNWQLYFHKGLDLSGGTHLELKLQNVPRDRDPRQVQDQAIQVINKRINSLGVSEPLVAAESDPSRIVVELAGVPSSRAQSVIGATGQLVYAKWVPDTKITGGAEPGFRPQLTGLTGADITNANSSTDQTGQWVVNVTMNSHGTDIFSKLTTDASTKTDAQNTIPIFLDLTQQDIDDWATLGSQLSQSPDQPKGKLISNPAIRNGPILTSQSIITGNFTQRSAQDLASSLNSGALPATMETLQITDVGATLGADSVRRSLAAGLLGLAIVIVFMISYYRIPGLLASLALLVYAGAVLMVFKTWPITLTLGGMAGFILSVGMAVDANVLIFERFKEEMRAGRTIAAGVEAAVRRAWPAIRDSNTATILTSLVLAYLGSGPVQGFAITLMIGVIISLISSIVVTHNLLAIVLNFGSFRTAPLLGVERARA